MKDPKKVKQGKSNRAAGQRFEKVVRKDLEEKGWIVDKWTNNVEFEDAPKEIKGRYSMQDIIDGKNYPKGTVRDEYGKPLKQGKLVPAKMGRYRTNQNGFPDFIAYRFNKTIYYIDTDNPEHMNQLNNELKKDIENTSKLITNYDYKIVPAGGEIIGVECKVNGYLSKEEKEKCKFYLDNNIFSKILIAKKKKVGRKIEVEYIGFEEKYLK